MQKYKILVIEDDEETRKILRQAFRMENFEVIEADEGEKGYKLALSEKPDLMILDVNLPVMSGFEVCSKLRDEAIKTPIIMLTGRKEPINRLRGLGCGADDYVEKPFNINELLQRVMIQIRHLNEARILAEDLLRKRWEEINEGLRLISASHRPFFHTPDVEGIRSAVHYMPFGKIGGDFYRIARLEDGKVEMLIGDAIGKGLTASFLMASTFAHLYRLVKSNNSPMSIFNQCNELLRRDFKDLDQYVAAFLAIYDPKTHIMKYATAGHQPPILIRNSGYNHKMLKGMGYFLGAFDDGQYEEVEIQIEKGDRIFFYTDGLLEIKDKSGGKLNFPRLYREILRNREKPIDALSTILIEKCKGYSAMENEMRDDLTFFFVEF